MFRVEVQVVQFEAVVAVCHLPLKVRPGHIVKLRPEQVMS